MTSTLRALILLTLSVIPVLANPLKASVSLYGPDFSEGCSDAAFSGSASASCSAYGFSSFANGTASASFGGFFASAEAHADGFFDAPVVATAEASLSDSLTVTGGTGGGSIEFFFEGLIQGCYGNAVGVQDEVITPFNLFPYGFCADGTTFDGATPLEAFTFGTAFPFFAFAEAEGAFSPPGEYSFFGGANLYLTDIKVFNADGSPRSLFRVTGASGHIYADSVPEPSVIVLSGLGLCLLLVRRRFT